MSPTAASRILGQVGAWPGALRAAAVGAGTRRELERHGVRGVIAPKEGADSEALLKEPELQQLARKRIVIFRGEGGRALLGDTLRERGAQVEYAACYRRSRPEGSSSFELEAIDAVTASSSEGLANLFDLLDPGVLRATPIFVPHARVADEARARGVQQVVVAGPSDEEMRDALVAYFRSHD